jgi:hypothetical protein
MRRRLSTAAPIPLTCCRNGTARGVGRVRSARPVAAAQRLLGRVHRRLRRCARGRAGADPPRGEAARDSLVRASGAGRTWPVGAGGTGHGRGPASAVPAGAAVTEFYPSDLRHRLTLAELSRVTDDGGGFTESWVEVATIFADLRPISGSERVERTSASSRSSRSSTSRNGAAGSNASARSASCEGAHRNSGARGLEQPVRGAWRHGRNRAGLEGRSRVRGG